MARRLTREQRQKELAAVEQALLDGAWHRPCLLSSATRLSTAVVLAALRTMAREYQVLRREYVVDRLHQGSDRIRKTTRLIVEYRRASAPGDFPAWLLPPAPSLTGTIRRVVFR